MPGNDLSVVPANRPLTTPPLEAQPTKEQISPPELPKVPDKIKADRRYRDIRFALQFVMEGHGRQGFSPLDETEVLHLTSRLHSLRESFPEALLDETAAFYVSDKGVEFIDRGIDALLRRFAPTINRAREFHATPHGSPDSLYVPVREADNRGTVMDMVGPELILGGAFLGTPLNYGSIIRRQSPTSNVPLFVNQAGIDVTRGKRFPFHYGTQFFSRPITIRLTDCDAEAKLWFVKGQSESPESTPAQGFALEYPDGTRTGYLGKGRYDAELFNFFFHTLTVDALYLEMDPTFIPAAYRIADPRPINEANRHELTTYLDRYPELKDRVLAFGPPSAEGTVPALEVKNGDGVFIAGPGQLPLIQRAFAADTIGSINREGVHFEIRRNAQTVQIASRKGSISEVIVAPRLEILATHALEDGVTHLASIPITYLNRFDSAPEQSLRRVFAGGARALLQSGLDERHLIAEILRAMGSAYLGLPFSITSILGNLATETSAEERKRSSKVIDRLRRPFDPQPMEHAGGTTLGGYTFTMTHQPSVSNSGMNGSGTPHASGSTMSGNGALKASVEVHQAQTWTRDRIRMALRALGFGDAIGGVTQMNRVELQNLSKALETKNKRLIRRLMEKSLPVQRHPSWTTLGTPSIQGMISRTRIALR